MRLFFWDPTRLTSWVDSKDLGGGDDMLDMIDWSNEKPNRNDLGQYVQDVTKAAPKTKFVYQKISIWFFNYFP